MERQNIQREKYHIVALCLFGGIVKRRLGRIHFQAAAFDFLILKIIVLASTCLPGQRLLPLVPLNPVQQIFSMPVPDLKKYKAGEGCSVRFYFAQNCSPENKHSALIK